MMRAVIGVGFLLATALVYGQASSGWPCAGELAKSEGDSRTLRVTIGVAETYVEKKILPDVSDLKRKKTNSTVVIKLLIGKDGAVRCSEVVQGDANLRQRSLEAVKQWRFRPYLLSGQPIIVDTEAEFVFKKGKVTAH